MENLYYTPDITEFHIGFECEIMDIKNAQWGTVEFKDGSCVEDLLDGVYGDIRVRHLDRKDIEEFFEYVRTKGNGVMEFKWDEYQIEFNPNKQALIISEVISIFGNDGCIFDGYIKNKSEFARLMRQLKIKTNG